jgi:hypothetical protein
MIQINNWERGTGKTTKVIEMLENHPDLYCIVPNQTHKNFYPKHLQQRILSGQNFEYEFRGRKIKKVVLDEGFLYPASFIAKLYYQLGKNDIDVFVYGTEGRIS